jgi:hypothetical protein
MNPVTKIIAKLTARALVLLCVIVICWYQIAYRMHLVYEGDYWFFVAGAIVLSACILWAGPKIVKRTKVAYRVKTLDEAINFHKLDGAEISDHLNRGREL